MSVVIGLLLGVAAVGAASYYYRERQRAFLLRPLEVDEPYVQQLAAQLGPDAVGAASVTLFDVLYHTMKLDPNALAGIARLHHAQEFRSLGDLMEFLRSEVIKAEPGETAWRQMVHKYKGYTGEAAAIEQLEAAGHDVEIPDSPVNPGYDVIVDGQPYNIKVTDNPSYIQQHLEQHPDIDVITNHEMSPAFGDNPRVLINPELSSQDAFQSTSETLGGIVQTGSWIDQIPWITLGYNLTKNGYKVATGDIDLGTAAEHTVLDTAAVGLGGKLGGKLGLSLGLALAPVTGGASAVVIPAVTSVIGTIIGILLGKGVTGWIKARHLRAAVAQLKAMAGEFRDEFLSQYGRVLAAAEGFLENRLCIARQKQLEEHPVKRFLFPSLQTTFFAMSSKELETERQKTRSFYDELRNKLLASDPSEGGMLLYAQGVAVLQSVSPLVQQRGAIAVQLAKVEQEKRKLR